MTAPILATPLTANAHGEIEDATGDNIADVWLRTHNGAPSDEEDDAEAEELCKQRAAEIVRRVNLHDELVEALRSVLDGRLMRDGLNRNADGLVDLLRFGNPDAGTKSAVQSVVNRSRAVLAKAEAR